MTIKTKTKLEFVSSTSPSLQYHQILSAALKVVFFIWHYLEMMLAMMVGSILFELLVSWLPAPARYATGLRPGTFLYSAGISLAMMLVMVAWMVVRGHGWRHSAEMSVAMLVPVALVAVISIQRGDTSLQWFDDNYCSAMCVGMLAAMFFRWNHFTVWSVKSSHQAHHQGHHQGHHEEGH